MSAIETLDPRAEYRELVEQEQVIYGLAGPNCEDRSYWDDLTRVASARSKAGDRLLASARTTRLGAAMAGTITDAVRREIEGPPGVEVRVFGPNLSRAGQAKGDLHVHLVGCGDGKHYGPGTRFGGEGRPWDISISTSRELVEAVYPPDDFDYDPETEIDAYRDSIYVAPCVEEAFRVYEGGPR